MRTIFVIIALLVIAGIAVYCWNHGSGDVDQAGHDARQLGHDAVNGVKDAAHDVDKAGHNAVQ